MSARDSPVGKNMPIKWVGCENFVEIMFWMIFILFGRFVYWLELGDKENSKMQWIWAKWACRGNIENFERQTSFSVLLCRKFSSSRI